MQRVDPGPCADRAPLKGCENLEVGIHVGRHDHFLAFKQMRQRQRERSGKYIKAHVPSDEQKHSERLREAQGPTGLAIAGIQDHVMEIDEKETVPEWSAHPRHGRLSKHDTEDAAMRDIKHSKRKRASSFADVTIL